MKLILMLNIDSVRQYSPKLLDTNQSMQSRDRREHTGEDRWTVEKHSQHVNLQLDFTSAWCK